MLPFAGWGGILGRGRDGRCGIGEGSGGQAFQRVYDPDSGRGGECSRRVFQLRQVSTYKLVREQSKRMAASLFLQLRLETPKLLW